MRFKFIEEHLSAFSIGRICHVMDVSPRGLRAFRSRPASRRQRSDLVTLAHIKEQSRLSLGSYGRPRITEELKEIGLDVGHRRVGRLIRQNGISVVRTRKHKATTIARQAIAKQSAERGTAIMGSTVRPTCWIRIFLQMPNQKWAGDIGRITVLCRSRFSFKLLYVQKPRGFSSLMRNVYGVDCRSH